MQTIFWSDTPTTRLLDPVSLLGQSVQIEATVDTVSWNFGDGDTATNQGPGRPYTAADHCGTKECPEFFGHTYRAAGTITVTAQVNWTGRFRVDNGPWQPIGGTVAGPTATAPLNVREAHTVLVNGAGR